MFSKSQNKFYWIIIFVLALVAIYLRWTSPLSFNHWIARDIERTFDFLNGSPWSFAGAELTNGGRLPGFFNYVLLGIPLLFSQTLDSIFSFGVLYSLVSGFIIFIFCFKYLSRNAALIFLFFFSFNGLMIDASHFPINPSFLFIPIALSIYFLGRYYFEGNGFFFSLSVIFLSLSTHIHFSSLQLLPAFLIVGFFLRKVELKLWLTTGALTFLTFVPFFIFCYVYHYPIVNFIMPQTVTQNFSSILLLSVLIIIALVFIYRAPKIFVKKLIGESRRIIAKTLSSPKVTLILLPLLATIFVLLKKGFTFDYDGKIGRFYLGIERLLWGNVYSVFGFKSPLNLTQEYLLEVKSLYTMGLLVPIVLFFIFCIFINVYYIFTTNDLTARKMKFTLVLFLAPFTTGVIFGQLTGSHVWYLFYLILSTLIFFATTLDELYSQLKSWITRENASLKPKLISCGLFLFACYLSIVLFTLNNYRSQFVKNSKEAPYSLDDSRGLVILDFGKKFVTEIKNLINLSPDEYTQRVFVIPMKYNLTSNFLYHYYSENKLDHYSTLAPERPALFSNEKPCLWIEHKGPWHEESQNYYLRIKSHFSQVSEAIKTIEGDTIRVIEYRPLFQTFCFVNTRLDFTFNENLKVVRENIDQTVRTKILHKNLEVDDWNKVKNASYELLLYVERLQIPFFARVSLASLGDSKTKISFLIDSEKITGGDSLSINSHINNFSYRFRNAKIVFGDLNNNQIVKMIQNDEASSLIFMGRTWEDPNYNVMNFWLSYLPIYHEEILDLDINIKNKFEIILNFTDGNESFQVDEI